MAQHCVRSEQRLKRSFGVSAALGDSPLGLLSERRVPLDQLDRGSLNLLCGVVLLALLTHGVADRGACEAKRLGVDLGVDRVGCGPALPELVLLGVSLELPDQVLQGGLADITALGLS